MIKVHKSKQFSVCGHAKSHKNYILYTASLSGSIWPTNWHHSGCQVLLYVNV